MTIISPSCRMGCKCRRTSGAGAECLGLSVQVLCSGTQSVECSSLDRVSPALWPDVTSLIPSQSTGAVLVSRGTLTWSQVLSAVLCESFCGGKKSPPPVGDRNTGYSAFMTGSQRRWRNLVRLTKNSVSRFKFQVKLGMPGSSACLLWGAFKVPVFKWINVIFNGKRIFFFLRCCSLGPKNFISDLDRKISNTALPTSHFSFPTRKMEKEARERGKMRWLFFQTKANFKSLKRFEHK